MAIIQIVWKVEGTPTDVTTAELSSPDESFGVRISGSGALVAPDGTPMVNTATGTYEYDLGPITVLHEYYVQILYLGITSYIHGYSEPDTSTLTGSELTSQVEMQRLFSSVGVNLRLDDLASTVEAIDEIVVSASQTVESYLLQKYDTVNLISSPWVRRRATVLACHELSLRRGNPGQFYEWYNQIMEELKAFLESGNTPIIPGVIVRAQEVPTASTYIVDDRYRYQKLRVVRQQSTKPYPGQPGYDSPVRSDFI